MSTRQGQGTDVKGVAAGLELAQWAPDSPPSHILASYQLGRAVPTQLEAEWGYGWRCDQAVLAASSDPQRTNWTAKLLAKMRPAGVAVSRPMVSTDGRYTVSGWWARSFVSGHRANRFDEAAAAALRVNEAVRGEPRPAFLRAPDVMRGWGEWEIFAAADAAAFAPDPTVWIAPAMDQQAVPRSDVAEALTKAAELADLRVELAEPDQLVHGDVWGSIVFDGGSDPGITDFFPAWHPAGWSVALLIVDAMSWANGPDDLLDRWSHVPEFYQLALRAVLYRLCLHAMLPHSQEGAWWGLRRTADVVAARVKHEQEELQERQERQERQETEQAASVDEAEQTGRSGETAQAEHVESAAPESAESPQPTRYGGAKPAERAEQWGDDQESGGQENSVNATEMESVQPEEPGTTEPPDTAEKSL